MAVIKGIGLQAVAARDPAAVEQAMSAAAALIEGWLVAPGGPPPNP